MRFGYACINNTLADEGLQVNRRMVKQTFLSKGIEYASTLALKNVSDFSRIIDWNIGNNITLYRMSSDMFPWMSEYELRDLPDVGHISRILERIGEKAKQHDIRLTFHPGPFNVLASSNPSIVRNTIKELRQHGEIMDLLKLPESHDAKINIHIGGSYGNRLEALDRFCENFQQLPANVRARLTIENDDKPNMFSVKDLARVTEKIDIPIVFDYLHHQFCTGDLTEKEAFDLAFSTWPKMITPIVHFSSSKKKYEDKKAMDAAHADFIYQKINLYNQEVDVMLEAKAKELAVIKYRKEYRIRSTPATSV